MMSLFFEVKCNDVHNERISIAVTFRKNVIHSFLMIFQAYLGGEVMCTDFTFPLVREMNSFNVVL